MTENIFFSDHIIVFAVFWSLIILSITSWYVIIYKIVKIIYLKQSLKNNNIEQFSKELALEHKENYNQKDIFQIKTQIEKGLIILASIGSISPFIGLFGTVWGIYFALIDISAQGNANISTVAGPMGEALIATALGLFAAIPAVVAYNYFRKICSNIYKEFIIICNL